MELLECLEQAIRLIGKKYTQEFTVAISLMADTKKDDYWGTSVSTFITDGNDDYNKKSVIYINMKKGDEGGEAKPPLIQVIKHELDHIVENKVIYKEMCDEIDVIYRRYLDEKKEKGTKRKV